MFKYLALYIPIIFLSAYPVSGQKPGNYDFERIEDNSFLIEEAYNQGSGEIHHISTFQLMNGNTWAYTFTEEWPVAGQKHQFSTTIPLLNYGEFGIGDIALSYRYQAIYKPRFAFSPRLSLLLPTGNYRKALGAGVTGYQLNLPFSYILSRYIVSHYNAGVTITPKITDILNSKSDHTNFNYGWSFILLLRENLNFMLEAVGNTTFVKSTNHVTGKYSSLFLNPGMRYAINFKSGFQIVPGIAVPIGLGSSSKQYGIFGYLAFEHHVRKQE